MQSLMGETPKTALHRFLTEAPWSGSKINERRLEIMDRCSQTKISRGFSLIIDDSGHRKSGNFTAGVGRQYIGEIGKTDNGIVVVTTHLYDGRKSLPLDIELYQHSSSLREGKQDSEFEKKPELALKLVDKTIERKYQPGIVIVDAGYGNNTSFLLELEKRRLKYLGGLAKNRKITITHKDNIQRTIRLDELAQSLPQEDFSEIELHLDKPKKLWVVVKEIEISQLVGKRMIAIVMNAATFLEATDIDYFITNVP
jgi:SRSO17 transposase